MGSGTEEQYNEKCQLLQDIKDLCRDFKKPIKKTKSIKQIVQEKGYTARANATIGVLKSTTPNFNEYENIYEDDFDENEVIELNENILETDNVVENNIHDTEEVNDLSEETSHEIPSTPITDMPQEEINDEMPSVNRKRKRVHGPLKLSTLNFLEQKYCAEQETQLKKLALEKQKLEVENKKFQLEVEKFALEKNEKTERLILEKFEKEEQVFMEKREREERLILKKSDREERLKLEIKKIEIANQQQKFLQLMLEQLIKK